MSKGEENKTLFAFPFVMSMIQREEKTITVMRKVTWMRLVYKV